MIQTPHGSLKAAVAAGATAKLTTENGTSVITFPLSGLLAGITMKVTLNSKDQVEKVETRMGNDTAETTYSDYKDLGEIKSTFCSPHTSCRRRETARWISPSPKPT